MDIQKIRDDKVLHEWVKYKPLDGQYVKYAESDPSIVAAGHKIEDTYYAFADARYSLLCAHYENYGDLAGGKDIDKLFIRAHFIKNAILEYGLCLDMSWQVVWAYVQPASFDYLMHQKYQEMEKGCERDSLFAQIDCAISQMNAGFSKAEKLKEILKKFDDSDEAKALRHIYNVIKHRGTLYIDGLGEKNDKMFLPVGDKEIQLLTRPSYTIEGLEEIIFNYHFAFEDYFNSLIGEIMPSDYQNGKVSFTDYCNTLIKMYTSLEKKE